MKKLILLLGLLLASCSGDVESETLIPEPAPVVDTSPATQAPLSMDAPLVVDKWSLWTSGTQLRGANTWQRIVVPRYDGDEFLGDEYLGPPYTQADFDALAKLGANYVNLSHPGVFTERPPYVLDEKIVANLDKMIAMATKADMFVVITFRTGPGRNDFTFYRDDDWFEREDLIETLWGDEESQAAWVEMWQYTAERYRDNPVVVGYDLICEPNANEILDEWDIDIFFATYGGTVYDWNRWYPEIVEAIREVDSETPILVAAEGYSALDWLPYLEVIDEEKIVYTFHQYEPALFTHQEAGENYSYPSELYINYSEDEVTFDRAWLADYLAIASDFSDEHGVPVAVNEYGVARWSEGADKFMHDQMGIFEEIGMNYALWVWDPDWRMWNEGVNFMTFRYGEDAENSVDVENDLQNTIKEFWSKNTVRPSNFAEQRSEPSSENWLNDMENWLYLIDVNLSNKTVDQIAASDYDMVVIDFISSESDNTDYPMAEVIAQLHNAPHPKKVIAYIDIGEAEEYRVYWDDSWGIGNPAWIVGDDPDGWAENYPVAFWAEEWQAIWLENGGMLDQVGAAGFDGVYLDWVEAYSDENVVEAARAEGVKPVYKMIEFVSFISDNIKDECEDCVVIAQNAAELVEYAEYAATIDGLAQEQVWFDGSADNEPEGDCPLPRTDADIDTEVYYDSLLPACQVQYDEFPESTLHVSSEEYLFFLNIAQEKGIPVFTIDYALIPENVAWTYATSRGYGFVPFVGNRALDGFIPPVP